MNKNKSIAVAVSGGADSLYSLISLHEAGHKVIAVHGLFGQHVLSDFCAEEKLDFMPEPFEAVVARIEAACSSLGVPLHVLDCSDLFLTKVVEPFVRAYALGDTPNPCSLCNGGIKFGFLLEKALSLGTDYFATGHYARLLHDIEYFSSGATTFLKASGPSLLQGTDPLKDQSYFLALASKEMLARTLFPLGNREKRDVLATLKHRGITPPQPKESQEVCFIPGNNYRKFLPFMAKRLGITLPEGGDIFLPDNRAIGRHKGLWQYTEGQRKGLGIGWKEPLHVLRKDKATNCLIVGPKNSVVAKGCICESCNILLPYDYWPKEVYVKTRYRENPKKASVRFFEEEGSSGWWNRESLLKMEVTFNEPVFSIASGQLAAVYLPVPDAVEFDGRPMLRLVAGGILSDILY